MDDIKQLVDEFDWGLITNPQSPEQFLMALVMVGIMGVLALVVFRLLQNLLA